MYTSERLRAIEISRLRILRILDYPLENLGPERFQHLCQALLVREHPRVQCFPVAQPDGGRDAVSFYAESSQGKFQVFQVKYARKPLAETDPHKWLAAIVEGEAPKIQNLIPRGASSYYLITNIPGTAHLGSGSIDKINAEISKALNLPSFCWWRDDINRRLDTAWDLKWSFPEVMTGPDFLRAIIESGISESRERRAAAIRAFLRSQYDMDEEVRFKQVELQNKLLDLFIDVPITLADQQADRHVSRQFRRAIRTIESPDSVEAIEGEFEVGTGFIDAGNHLVFGLEDHIGAATLLLSAGMQKYMPQVVVEGAPGQGKSTLAQYICQIQRMKLLGEENALSSLPTVHAKTPIRLPIKVDLRDFATWLSRKNPFAADIPEFVGVSRPTLEGFLAALISHQSGGASFSTDDLLAIVGISSTLLVFDGLDEVADMAHRREVVEEIVKGVQRLKENAASLQTIVTSRPAAFANSQGMPRSKYPHLQLVSLNRPLITEYADRWLRARRSDSKQIAESRAVLKEKLDQPHLRDLARNPMQLAILLSLIQTRGASLPDKRTALYEFYIDLFFSREAAKSSVVRDHRELLIEIHRYIAWLLHSEAEQGQSSASIPQDRLQQLVAEYLTREGHDASLASALFTGMVERVVALVSRVQGTFEFEVQPLREYFAACHLYYTAPQSSPGKERSGSKPDRFDAICRNFYWLNVTRFFAGCYSKGELPSLVERLQELASEDGFRSISYPGNLAATLLADWVFTQNPKSVHQVIDIVLQPEFLRRLLAPYVRRGRRSIAASTLALPPRCGREQLVARCFELLNGNPPRDFASHLIGVLATNSDEKASLIKVWTSYFRASTADRRLRWLEYGLELDVLATVELSALENTLTELDLQNEIDSMRILFCAGRLDYIERSEDRFNKVLGSILDRTITARPQRRIESALHAVNHALDAGRYALAFRDRQPVPLADLLESRNRAVRLTWPDQLLTNTETYEAHKLCVEIAKIAEGECRRLAAEWATELSPWNTVIEAARSRWGEKWAFTLLANVAAGIRSKSERCSEYSNLLNHNQPLAFRVRYARLRSGAQKWWSEQFNQVRTSDETLFTLLIALTWAKSPTLLSNQDQISEHLASLDQHQWERLFYSLQRCRNQARSREESSELVGTESIQESPNLRFLAVLAHRLEPSARRVLYMRHFESAIRDQPILMNLISREAQDAEHFGTDSWAPNLGVIKACYRFDRCSILAALHRPSKSGETPTIALPIAKEILEAPSEFPSFLVALSEERVRADVSARVKPVAAVAATERWFTLI